jgi:hypothetical protein
VITMVENNIDKTRLPAAPGGLDDPMLNCGMAFSPAEQEAPDLTGRLPAAVLTLKQRALRAAFSNGLVVGIDAQLRPKVAGGAQAADASDLSQVLYRLAGRVTVGGQVSASPPRRSYQ